MPSKNLEAIMKTKDGYLRTLLAFCYIKALSEEGQRVLDLVWETHKELSPEEEGEAL